MRIELVTRAGCHLCQEVLDQLRTLGVEPRLREVGGEPELSRLYDFRVPVLLVDGRVVAEGKISPDQLRRLLKLRSATGRRWRWLGKTRSGGPAEPV